MSNSFPEIRPLLCDDNSDEEFYIRSYNYHRRTRSLSSTCRERVRNHAKGAAAVLTRWPDNCSTAVTYWWIGVIMIAITLFVIYNSVLIFGMIPTSNIKQPKFRNFNIDTKPKAPSLYLPDVYMHLIINNDTDVDLNKYLPHVDVISKTYPSFKYTLFVVLNDTSRNIHDFNDNHKNEIALNSLWTDEKFDKETSSKYNISIEYMSLTTYFNNSPLKKFWRHLPSYLIDFLLQSVSIWEKGGIAFNPTILTPKSPYPNYMKKLHELFFKFAESRSTFNEAKKTTKAYSGKSKIGPNNIQDIINALNKEDTSASEMNLNAAENKVVPSIASTENILQSKNFKNDNYIKLNENKTWLIVPKEKRSNTSTAINDSYTDNILPLVLKYIFHNKPKKERSANTSDLRDPKISKYSQIMFNNAVSSKENKMHPVDMTDNNFEQINFLKDNASIFEKLNQPEVKENVTLLNIDNYDNVPELSIDLKGNIIASKTACHAFLGTIFSNIIHHTEEKTLSDFIISELSIFCNGLLTSCPGVNVILV